MHVVATRARTDTERQSQHRAYFVSFTSCYGLLVQLPGCLGGSYVKVSRKLTIWEGLLVNSVHVSATDWGSNSLAAEQQQQPQPQRQRQQQRQPSDGDPTMQQAFTVVHVAGAGRLLHRLALHKQWGLSAKMLASLCLVSLGSSVSLAGA